MTQQTCSSGPVFCAATVVQREQSTVYRWQEVRDYILERKDAIRGTDISQEELLTGKAPKKGFS